MDLEGKRQIAFLNEGINGNTLTAFPTGAGSTPGIERLDRDVLSHSGVTHVVLFIGTNDIRRGPPAAQVISGMENVIQRVKARGIRIYGVTVIPRHISAGAAGNPGWTAEANKVRDEVNTWIRNKGQFDAVIDFDKVVRDPASPERIAAAFDCDGIHLSPRGYYEAARSIRLDLFDRPKARR